jgi:hypothetical protein
MGGYRAGMTSTGMRPPPDPDDPADIEPRSDVGSVPDEEHLDPGTVEDDLALEPDEKRNATDGYAPADDDPDTLELDEQDR